MTKPTSSEKWTISTWSVVAVILLFNPLTFKITNILSLLSPYLATTRSYGPTMFGYFLHFVAFFFLVRVMMEIKLPGVKDTFVTTSSTLPDIKNTSTSMRS